MVPLVLDIGSVTTRISCLAGGPEQPVGAGYADADWLSGQGVTFEGDDAFTAHSSGHESRANARERAVRADLELIESAGPTGLDVEELPAR